MKKPIILLLAALMTLLQCAENEFEYNNPLDDRGTNYRDGAVTAFTDSRDNKAYWKVTIGKQTWMAENLNFAAEGSKCYGNSNANCEKYGRLYTWDAANSACPSGWHLPSDDEWTTLVEYAGGSSAAGTKLKSSTGWNSFRGVPKGTDDYGFSALPGGHGESGGSFSWVGRNGYWWNATLAGGNGAWNREMDYSSKGVGYDIDNMTDLFSVRCVADSGTQTPTTYTVMFDANGGTVSPVSGETGENGTLASLPEPLKSGYTFAGWYTAATDGTQVTEGTVFGGNSTIYARWNTSSGGGGATFTDSRDGKTYKKVTIGTQVWMAENLNYDVPDNTSDVCYNNNESNCTQYGRLYNWSTAMGIDAKYNSTYWGEGDEKHQGVCPVGWHVPSDAEWTALTDFVGGALTAGTKLKSTSRWYNNGNGTDQYGFSALPSGDEYSGGHFFNTGHYGNWWSATEYNADYAWFRHMYYNYEYVGRSHDRKTYSFSVRCVADTGTQTPTTYTVRFDANGGTVSPTSDTTGADGKLASLPTPTRSDYIFEGWFTEATGGTKVEVSKVYSANTTVYAQWGEATFTDSRDSTIYKRVQIGNQVWMGENLNYDTSGSVCYGGSADSCEKYGRLYNWSTAMNGALSSSLRPSGVQGVCPVGWHIPSYAEWTELTKYVGGASTAGTKLKSSTDWASSSGVPVGTNEYGFSALPGGSGGSGFYSSSGFYSAGYYGRWWSATEGSANSAWRWYMGYDNEYVSGDDSVKTDLFSVRCVADQ